MTNEMQREVFEAIAAGERALQCLYSAQKELNSAENWGFADMLGGGLVTTMIKRSKMNNAVSHMEDAKNSLRAFQRELRDVTIYADLNLNADGFLGFADYFFDGILADYLVQSRIGEAQNQVEQAIRQVQNLLTDLRRL